MDRIVVMTRAGSDGSVHLDLPAGSAEPNSDVQVTIEPTSGAVKRPLHAADLLQSDLVGIWAGRGDIGDSRDFARRLRQQAQTREHSQ